MRSRWKECKCWSQWCQRWRSINHQRGLKLHQVLNTMWERTLWCLRMRKSFWSNLKPQIGWMIWSSAAIQLPAGYYHLIFVDLTELNFFGRWFMKELSQWSGIRSSSAPSFIWWCKSKLPLEPIGFDECIVNRLESHLRVHLYFNLSNVSVPVDNSKVTQKC